MIVLQTRTGGFHKAGIDRGRIGKAPVTAAGNIASGWRLVLMSVPLGFKTTARNWAKRKWQANSRDRHVYDTIKCFEHQLSLTSFEGMSGLYLNDGITQWNWFAWHEYHCLLHNKKVVVLSPDMQVYHTMPAVNRAGYVKFHQDSSDKSFASAI